LARSLAYFHALCVIYRRFPIIQIALLHSTPCAHGRALKRMSRAMHAGKKAAQVGPGQRIYRPDPMMVTIIILSVAGAQLLYDAATKLWI